MNFKEKLNCLLEREEHIQAELAKPDYLETLEGTLFYAHTDKVERKTDDKGNVYFFVGETYYFSFVCPLVLTSEQMKAYIGYENPKWNKEIEKMIKENPNEPLHEILHTWFLKHPRITEKLTINLNAPDNKYLSKNDVQDDPIDMYIPQDIFYGESWYGMMMEYFMAFDVILCPESWFIENKIKGKLLSRFDQLVILFREEIGVRSLQEIESLESAICYLLYRKSWINRYLNEMQIQIDRWETYKAYLEYISKHPNHSTFEFFSSRNGFGGQLWASYDEFHDKWLDDSFVEQLEDENIITIYENVRALALKRLS